MLNAIAGGLCWRRALLLVSPHLSQHIAWQRKVSQVATPPQGVPLNSSDSMVFLIAQSDGNLVLCVRPCLTPLQTLPAMQPLLAKPSCNLPHLL